MIIEEDDITLVKVSIALDKLELLALEEDKVAKMLEDVTIV